jgi:hypothetical protein
MRWQSALFEPGSPCLRHSELFASCLDYCGAHRAAQLHERMTAGPAWHEGDFVWCQPNGRLIGNHVGETSGMPC